MSMAAAILYCDACDSRWSSAVLWGHFVYSLPGGQEISIDRVWGWCDCCRSFEPIERLPSDKPTTIAGRLLHFARRNHPGNDELMAKKQLMRMRTEPPKCLSCGSQDVTYFEWPRFPLGRISPASAVDAPNVSTGQSHPGCDGKLWLTYSRFRFIMKMEQRFYDGNGNLLKREQSWR